MPNGRPIPRLMLVTDRTRSRLPLPELAREAVAGGVDAVQLREKDLSRKDLTDLAQALQRIAGPHVRLFLNGDPELAAELGLNVHLPEAGAPLADVRRIVGPDPLIGRSVHSVAAAVANTEADYLIGGHVFPSRSKPGLKPIRLEGLRAIAAASTPPVLAIGGISPRNVRETLAAGAHGIAVIDAIAAAANPRRAAQELRDAIDGVQGKEQTVSNVETEANVVVNGKDVAVLPGASVADFLTSKGFREKFVVVELNGRILDRASFASTTLVAGDKVEIVHFVGGG